jgi:hypothetical protein
LEKLRPFKTIMAVKLKKLKPKLSIKKEAIIYWTA